MARLTRGSLLALGAHAFSHYCTGLYGLLAPVIAAHFFSEKDPIHALVLTYAIIPIGLMAKPVGSLFFGYWGDTRGRGRTLQWVLTGVGISTLAMGCLPGYGTLAWAAPALLAMMKGIQSFFSAGETCGGAVLVLEQGETKDWDWLSALVGACNVGGILLASLCVWSLHVFGVEQWAWRGLFAFGALLAVLGLSLRRQVNDAPCEPRPGIIGELRYLWVYRSALFSLVLGSGFSYACYMVALVLINGWVPLVTDLGQREMMEANTWMLILDILLFALFAWVARRTSGLLVMTVASLSAACLGGFLFSALAGAGYVKVLGIRMVLVGIGVAFSAPMHSWASSLVPKRHRYKLYAVGYAVGTQLLGAPTAAVSLWLFEMTGAPATVSIYWSSLGLLTSGALAYSYARTGTPAGTRQPGLV